MAMRSAARYVSRRFSTGGKILSEEEKAAENIYIKKMEKEKLEKMAHKQGPKAEETTDAAKATASSSSSEEAFTSTEKLTSTERYAYLAVNVALLAAFVWREVRKSPVVQEWMNMN